MNTSIITRCVKRMYPNLFISSLFLISTSTSSRFSYSTTKPRYGSNHFPSPFYYSSLRMINEDFEEERFGFTSILKKEKKGYEKTEKRGKKTAYIGKKDSFMKASTSKTYIPKTENQKKYVDLLNNPDNSILVVVGPAGSGKTLFACTHSIQLLQAGKIRKIVLTRPMISVEEEEFGFLPGDLVTKMDPWTKPIFDIFKEFYTPPQITEMIKQEVIEIAPLAFMRGRTFHDSFIIADEMQNSSPTQMLMLSTRIGNGSKMVITGDLQQSDRLSGVNGLNDFLNKYKIWNGQTNSVEIGLIEMTQKDISRSKTVSTILDFYRISTTEEKKPSSDGRVNYKKNSDSALMPMKDIIRSFRTDTYL